MKTRSPFIIVATLALALSACIPSLNPYFAAKDLVSDARLVGQWKADDDSMTWRFEDDGEKSYTLTITEKESKSGTLSAHLFKIDREMFLDLIPTKCEFAKEQSELVSMAVFPGHLLAHVKSIDPQLKVSFIDWDWLKKFLEKTPHALAHRIENEDQIILTANTRDLQRFVSKHLGKDELFGDEVDIFVRVKSAEAAPAKNP